MCQEKPRMPEHTLVSPHSSAEWLAYREQPGHNRRIVRQGNDLPLGVNMAETSKATIAGVCDIVAGIAGLIGGIPLLVLAVVGSGALGALPDPAVRPLAAIPLAFFLPLALMCFLAGVVAIAGGVAALNRRRWGLALAGSIAAVFGFFPAGIVAVIFTILAEPEFRAAD